MTSKMKSFFKGVGRVIEIYPPTESSPHSKIYHQRIINGPKTNSDAIRGDWQRVGQSFWKTIDKLTHERTE